MAGGTGGHIFPALAVAKLLTDQGHPVVWLGSQKSMEARRVPEAGITFYGLRVSGLRGKGKAALLLAPFRLLISLWQAVSILRSIKPACVVGFGGFASGPGGLAAWLLRIPLFVHEQNALPGMTNRWLSRMARRVFTAFPQAFSDLPKALCVGNPVRAELLQLPPPAQRYAERSDPVRLLVVGGSLGAQSLNTSLPAALALLSQSMLPVSMLPQVRHQTGANKEEATRAAYAAACPDLLNRVEICSFIEDMAEAMGWADLVICRAGALTISELAAVGVASLLVPFPFAVDDHQTHNAHFLADAGAAILLPQSELTPAGLAELLQSRLLQRDSLAEMAVKAAGLARISAGEQMVQTLLKDIS
ncbi:MAG: undecaprenyldiphospho-muramoylpentapeptide beta-N-acetylglucosaminyltransferase [Marinospirillum sp.]|nr:undecaprenyldiphospho-muramoylpentapeptide beta-N-acetylglucosaminyltransferase [Marinospirillum sp.]